jgi:hypothetical protein
MPVFGAANLEFGGGDPERAGSGGVPGGRGTHSGVGWQLLYAAVTILSVVTLGGLIKGVLRGLFVGLRRLFTRGFFSRQFWRNAFTRLRRFFWDPRRDPAHLARTLKNDRFNFTKYISRPYWAARGGAGGRSLHHWLFPLRARWVPWGFINAGFNRLNMPAVIRSRFGGLNQWMGMVLRSGSVWEIGAAHSIEWGIRLVIVPGAIAGSGYGGFTLGEYLFGDQDSEPEPRRGDSQAAP